MANKDKVYAVFRGKAYWFNNLFVKNKYSEKYELILGNLDEENTKKAEDLGLYVRKDTPGKEAQGNWIKMKSGFPPWTVMDRNRNVLTEAQVEELSVGNGSEVVAKANIWKYKPNPSMVGATGVAASAEKVQLIKVEEYIDDDADFQDYDTGGDEDLVEAAEDTPPAAAQGKDDLDDDLPF